MTARITTRSARVSFHPRSVPGYQRALIADIAGDTTKSATVNDSMLLGCTWSTWHASRDQTTSEARMWAAVILVRV
ncbi:hypothetical protein D3C85_1685200 [compost metagenome]